MQEPKLNMKGRIGEISYYRRIHTGEVKPVHRTRIDEKTGEKVKQEYLRKTESYVFFKEDEVIDFSLDQYGHALPDFDRDYTRIKNYLLYFWMPFLGRNETMLYITLLSYCYGKEKDYCFPSMKKLDLILGTSRPSLIKYMEKLEDYGFIFRFWTLIPGNENKEDTPIIKVRKQTPYLPNELYEKLPGELKEEHDKMVMDYAKKFNTTLVPYSKPDFSEIHDEYIRMNGHAPEHILNDQREKINSYHRLRSQISEKMLENTKLIFNKLNNNLISKPAFETYFTHALLDVEDGEIIVYVGSLFQKEGIEQKYKSIIIAAYQELVNENVTELKVINYK
ncbi:helix-turn-helix domain-containing protein [Priestia megaterium]|uniref:hypothetical protein n=1 Tax=Priestia megaterium TaxID=1404 RepID=UPI003CFFC148